MENILAEFVTYFADVTLSGNLQDIILKIVDNFAKKKKLVNRNC